MLRLASNVVTFPVAARVPGLPFLNDAFSTVTVAFVISHAADYMSFLADVLRCLRPGGCAGFTAWGNNENEFRKSWEEVAHEYIPQEETKKAIREAIPWEELFSNPENLSEACRTSGFQSVRVEERNYELQLSREEFLSYRNASMQGRLLQHRLPGAKWNEFHDRIRNVFESSFPDILHLQHKAFLCIGTKK